MASTPRFDRDEMEEMLSRWLKANEDAEKKNDWRDLGQFYTEDATYGWNYGPKEDFMAVGRKEITELALGTEMEGLEGWTYPYETNIIDNYTGNVVCFWRQISDAKDENGENFEVYGIGGSWFRYAGDFQWEWQRDFFDFGHVSELFMKMITSDSLSEGMKGRIDKAVKGEPQPGWYPLGEAPVKLW